MHPHHHHHHHHHKTIKAGFTTCRKHQSSQSARRNAI
ncbi:hypothetical protein BofuT4_uP056980.1 [Botrytis cinerea T4]|uniref:Uncharacterized protein n=1 Tax=Botryotinia fuckeliana (strain T4) TaxID=999810 RepID=G2XWC7_BOTF4|nr:hypothetical protein BofuT4_uP056980.1 [Botrytis cinerea T4]